MAAPFFRGQDDRFSEKTKKNLSQNYGRWIVGFDGPMTSAFFALKKGAENGGVLYVRRKHIAEGKISARGRTEAPAQGAGCKAILSTLPRAPAQKSMARTACSGGRKIRS